MAHALTVIVPTFNEELNIRDCLESVKWADELLIVDSFSTDSTLEICKEYTERILHHEYINSAAQKNWTIPQARCEWVLIVDSDERVPEKLKTEILEAIESNEYDGFYMPRKSFFCGREVKHCGWEPEHDRNLRLFKKDRGRYEDKEVHADVTLDGRAGYLNTPLEHYTVRNLNHYFQKFQKYTVWAAADILKKQKKVRLHTLMLRPAGTFLKMYILKRGFQDGITGFTLCILSSFYTFLKYARAWEIQNTDGNRHAQSTQENPDCKN